MVEITTYNHKWPSIYKTQATEIEDSLGDNLVAIHHIGSTSVPGLMAKPKIDILAVVKKLHKVSQLGYKYRGEFNIPFHSCYTKREQDLNVNLHIFEENNPEIELNTLFRDYLISHPEAIEEYQSLKKQLISQGIKKDDQAMFHSYNLGKNEFIQKILKKAGFNKLVLKYCVHYAEWNSYHKIRKNEIFDKVKVEYDINHYSLKDPQHKHFVLYQGTEIIGVAQTEFLSLGEVALRPFAIDSQHQNQGLGSQFLKLIEKWVRWQGRNCIRLNAEPKALNFYLRLGYIEREFKDYKKRSFKTIPMFKLLTPDIS